MAISTLDRLQKWGFVEIKKLLVGLCTNALFNNIGLFLSLNIDLILNIILASLVRLGEITEYKRG